MRCGASAEFRKPTVVDKIKFFEKFFSNTDTKLKMWKNENSDTFNKRHTLAERGRERATFDQSEAGLPGESGAAGGREGA